MIVFECTSAVPRPRWAHGFKPVHLVPLDPVSLAWAAGFFDGEGSSCQTFSHGRKYWKITVAQAEIEPLERLQRALGVGHVRGPFKSGTFGSKPIWHYVVDGHYQVQHVACLLWQWLGTPKREQFARTLKVR